MVALHSSETSVTIDQSTGRNILEDFEPVIWGASKEDGHFRRSGARCRLAIKSYSALFIFRYLSPILCFYFISFFYFFILCLPTLLFISLLLGCLKPSRDHNASFTLSYHFNSQRQRKEYSFHFLFFPFVSLCSPSISVLSLVISKRIFTPWDFTNSVFSCLFFC